MASFKKIGNKFGEECLGTGVKGEGGRKL